jgi:GAF domain-containing protein
LLDPEQLIPRVVELIRERFRFYYAGLFLVDAENRYAVLQYGAGVGTASDAGKTMKERGHKLEIGGGSMIGWACANRQARIALDVGQDAVRFANPLTPETRSEMALPLRAGERVIGALTIQSVQEAAFDESDIAALQGMADQIAVAMENARLFAESRAALEATRRAYGELSRSAWTELLHARPSLGLRKSGTIVTTMPGDAAHPPYIQAALQTGRITPAPEGNSIAVPIKVRDQVIGVVEARKPADAGEWPPQQIALLETLTDQMSTALESARLYQDTQRRATQEKLIGEVTGRMRETLDMETILKTAISEMRNALDLAEVEIDINPTLAAGTDKSGQAKQAVQE